MVRAALVILLLASPAGAVTLFVHGEDGFLGLTTQPYPDEMVRVTASSPYVLDTPCDATPPPSWVVFLRPEGFTYVYGGGRPAIEPAHGAMMPIELPETVVLYAVFEVERPMTATLRAQLRVDAFPDVWGGATLAEGGTDVIVFAEEESLGPVTYADGHYRLEVLLGRVAREIPRDGASLHLWFEGLGPCPGTGAAGSLVHDPSWPTRLEMATRGTLAFDAIRPVSYADPERSADLFEVVVQVRSAFGAYDVGEVRATLDGEPAQVEAGAVLHARPEARTFVVTSTDRDGFVLEVNATDLQRTTSIAAGLAVDPVEQTSPAPALLLALLCAASYLRRRVP